MKNHHVSQLLVFTLCVSAAACGASAPTAPASPATSLTVSAAPTTTARISGSVAGATTGLASSTFGVPAGLSVSVPGTSISSTVDAFGQFTLNNVAPGVVELKFTNTTGINATVAVGTVAAGDLVNVKVTVGTTTATVDDKDQVKATGEREVEGIVESVSAAQCVVAGKIVSLSASTVYTLNGYAGLAADVVVGARVTAKGTATATGLTALTVAITTSPVSVTPTPGTPGVTTEVELTGTVASKSGSCPTIAFALSGTTFVTNSATDFRLACTSVTNGTVVQAKGTRAADGTVTATRVKIDDTQTPGTTTEVELTGTVASKSGSCPTIAFALSGTTFVTNSATDFRLACTSVTNGTVVEAKGTRAADGTVTATRVKKS